MLLAAAVLAGVLALLQQRRAEDAADAANAQRLGALALVEKRPDTAVLLALEATRFGASPETKGALFDTLMKYGHVLRVARTEERVLRMAAPTTGGSVAVSDNSGHLMLYDPRTLARRRQITLPFIVDLAYAPDGRAVYAAGLVDDDPRDQAIRAVDPASGDVLWTRRVPLGERGLSVTRDGRHVAWSADKVFVLLDSRTGSEVARLPLAPGSKTVPLPDGRALVLRGRSATIVDMSSKHAVRRLHLPAGEVTALAVTTDGSRVAIGHEDGTVAVVRLDIGRIVPMREPHEGFVESVAFSPDGTRLATAGDNDGRVLVWNPRTGERVDVLTGHGAGLRAIAFADAGRTLVSSGLDSTLIAWDVANDRAMLRSFDVPGPPCHEGAGCFFPQFSVSRDGSKLAILGADSRVRFVDSERLRPAGALTARALACCQEPAFSADGRTLATAWIDPMGISLWDTSTGRLTRRLFSSDEPWPDRREHAPPLDTVAYAPDGSSGGCTNFFEVPIETPISPKMDVTAFRRVLIAGFISGGTDDVDANLETVRLFRSQLQSKSGLRVIEADVLPLAGARRRTKRRPTPAPEPASLASSMRDVRVPPVPAHVCVPRDWPPCLRCTSAPGAPAPDGTTTETQDQECEGPGEIPIHLRRRCLLEKNRRRVRGPADRHRHRPFRAPTRPRDSSRATQETYDQFGRRLVVPLRSYMERKGFAITPKFIFIDGRTGATLHTESLHEEILYSSQQNTPALSSYFELMDKVIPTFLGTLSTQKIRGTRVLLR